MRGLAGTGPWILKEHKENQYALFTANASYWGEKPRLQAVRWKVMPDHQAILLALHKGDVDLVFGADGDMLNLDNFDAIRREGRYAAAISQPIASRAILLNAHQPFTRERDVRLALQYAVDREGIAATILNGSETVAPSLLASTDITPHQAFRAGPGQLALQFHAEADAARMEHWLMGHACELAAARLDVAAIRQDARDLGGRAAAAGQTFFRRWLDSVFAA